MHLTDEIKNAVDKSVLCWLASCDEDRLPNVSPKEIFTYHGEKHIIIANIASPQSVKNIKANPKVCLSFIDIIIQKGFQLKGKAEIIEEGSESFQPMKVILEKMTQGKYPFKSIIKINVETAKPILAPSYFMFPDMNPDERISSAKKAYGF